MTSARPDSPDAEPTAAHLTLGRHGEDLALAELERLGFRILARNLRNRSGEIDLVALDREALVFVEVKTRSTDRFGSPAEAVDRRKQRRIMAAARELLNAGTGTGSGSAVLHAIQFDTIRFDVVSVVNRPSGPELEHIPDAFQL